MHGNRARSRIRVVVGVTVTAVAVGACVFLGSRHARPIPIVEPAFDGDFRELNATEVVLTLDSPTRKEMNVIWCASFLAAWKTLETDLAGERLSLQGAPEVAMTLDKAADPRPHIPEANLYVAAGWNQKGILGQIGRELARKFPAKAAPTFPGILEDSFVAYAYLEANVRFSLPYFQNRRPLVFTDRVGEETELSSFGIRAEDDYAYFKLRGQPRILFEARGGNFELTTCIIDLDRNSKPNQIILSLMAPQATLADMVKSVEDKIAAAGKHGERDGLGPNDVLLVPDIVFRISRRFAELEKKVFTNPNLKGQRIDFAQQDIQFRLDRSGAELKSESKLYMMPIPTYYVFNRPFLICMKKRGAEQPYFVMWVGNAKLLKKWQANGQPLPDADES